MRPTSPAEKKGRKEVGRKFLPSPTKKRVEAKKRVHTLIISLRQQKGKRLTRITALQRRHRKRREKAASLLLSEKKERRRGLMLLHFSRGRKNS